MNRPIEYMPRVNPREYLALRASQGQSFENVTLTFRGRDAISLACRHFGLTRKVTALLPGYLCDTVTAAMAPYCHFDFYDIEENFVVAPSVIEQHLSRQPARVVYLIHYFGFLQPHLAEIRDICVRHGSLLWEDHAHSALSRFSWDYADAMVFSFRKLLPIPEGGGIWIRDLAQLPELYGSVLGSDVRSLAILVKRVLCHVTPSIRDLVGKLIQSDIDSMNAGQKEILPHSISHMSRRIIRDTDLATHVSIRRQQYLHWLELLADLPLQPVFPSLPEDVCPLGFPVRIGNPVEVVRRLERFGIFLRIHWRDMPPAVEQSCPMTWRTSQSIITLPIYPGLTLEEMHRVVRWFGVYACPMSQSDSGTGAGTTRAT